MTSHTVSSHRGRLENKYACLSFSDVSTHSWQSNIQPFSNLNELPSRVVEYENNIFQEMSWDQKIKEAQQKWQDVMRPKTTTRLGQKLRGIRAKIVASGTPLLNWEELEQEVKARRGGIQ